MIVVRMEVRKEINHKRARDEESEVKGRKGFREDRDGLEFGIPVQNMLDVDEETGPLV